MVGAAEAAEGGGGGEKGARGGVKQHRYTYCTGPGGGGRGVEVPLRPGAVAVVWEGEVVGGTDLCSNEPE